MKSSFIRTVSFMLALLMCGAATMVSCSESTENAETDTDSANVGSAEVDETIGEETEPERLFANVPDSNFDGYTFNIFCSSNSEYSIIQNDFKAEELTGEAINDAKFNRNIKVGDKLNVKIATVEAASVGHDAGYNELSKAVTAGTVYDLATACGYTTSKLSMSNYLYDMNNVPYLDLNAKWWDSVANDSLKVLGQLFYTTGDITVSDNDATYCVMFNKNLITDYNMENPYEMVEKGTWTVDKFIEMASAVSLDLNGDGKFDQSDRYGALIWDDTMMGVVNCSGEKCAVVGDDGLIKLTLNTEKTIDILDKFLTFSANKDIAYAYQRTNWSDSLLVEMFSGDQSLFLTQLIQLVPKMREMDSDFGILPYFKYNEAQEKYYTTIGSWHSVFVCVPTCQDDVTRTGIVTEVLANEALYELTEAYYDKTLKGKTTRDEESSAMLDIIFANRIYDLGWYFQFGTFNESVMNMFRNYKNEFTSMYKKNEKMAEKVIKKTNEAFIEAKAEAEQAANP